MSDLDERPWQLWGLDTFSNDIYPISRHDSEAECLAAAREHLRELEGQQPSELSGGQDGIQDQIFIVGPNGTRYRYERVLDA
jgi:hypothetical protein